MTRPTKEQLEQARAWLRDNWSLAPDPRDLTDEGLERTVEKIGVLLAATAEPTDEELRAEAIAYLNRARPFSQDTNPADYIAGARREGAR